MDSGLEVKAGEASCLGGNDSCSLDGLAMCCAERNGQASSELVLCTREEPFVCEPLSCCIWVLISEDDQP
jgi:hypothetical protein